MKHLYILGSGGFAREVYNLTSRLKVDYKIEGFIDKAASNDFLQIDGVRFPIISDEVFLEKNNPITDLLVMGVGSPMLIERLAAKFREFTFPNIISPNAVVDGVSNELGIGNVITDGVIFTTNIKVGNFNIFNLATTVGHDAIISDFNVINPAVNISGGVKMGNGNLIGVNATILQYLSIGNNNTIGASSLVTKSVDSNSTLVGIPAKKMESK